MIRNCKNNGPTNKIKKRGILFDAQIIFTASTDMDKLQIVLITIGKFLSSISRPKGSNYLNSKLVLLPLVGPSYGRSDVRSVTGEGACWPRLARACEHRTPTLISRDLVPKSSRNLCVRNQDLVMIQLANKTS